MREHLERKFPLRCSGCARTFTSLRDYLVATTHVGAPVASDLEAGAEVEGSSEAGNASSLALCSCGTTIALDSSGMPLTTRLALARFARSEAKRRGISFRQFLRELRADIDRSVLDDPSAGASPEVTPEQVALEDSSAAVARHMRFVLGIGVVLGTLIVIARWASGSSIAGALAVWALLVLSTAISRALRARPRVAALATVACLGAVFVAALFTFGPLAGSGVVLAIATLLVAAEFGRGPSIATSIVGGAIMLAVGALAPRFGWDETHLPLLTWVRAAVVSSGLSVFIALTASSLVGGLRDALARLEVARRENERMLVDLARRRELETVGRLVGGVVHDVNNSLTVLASCVEVLEDQSVPEGTREVVADLAEAVQTTHGTMRGLLELVRTDPAEPGTCDPAEAIARVLRNLRRLLPEDVELETSLVEGHRVPMARGPLVQAVLNLILNARDALEGSRVKKRITVTIEPSEDTMVLAVRDNGRGMDADTALRAGEPLFTTKGASGTGLGLSTVRTTVEAAGGRVLVESALGTGTEVRIVLPRVAPSATRLAPEKASGLRGVRVLLVEDDEGIRRAFARALASAGATILEAASVEAALGHLASSGEAPDILLCDGVLGDGTAADVVPRFTAERPGAPVLVVSGHELGELTARGLVLTKDVRWVAKPLSAGELTRLAGKALGLGVDDAS